MLKMTSLNVILPGVTELPTTVKTIQQHKMLMIEHYLYIYWYIHYNCNCHKLSKTMEKSHRYRRKVAFIIGLR